MVTESVISDSEVDTTPLHLILKDAQRSAAVEDYVALAYELGSIRSKPYFHTQILMDAIPLAEKLGGWKVYLGHHKESSGPQEALYFLQYAAEKLTDNKNKQQAIQSWNHVFDGLMNASSTMALDIVTDIFVGGKDETLLANAASKVAPLIEHKDFKLPKVRRSSAFGKSWAKASSLVFNKGYIDEADLLATQWRQTANALASKDHLEAISHAIEVADRIDNESPLEKMWADFILSNHPKTYRLDPEQAIQALNTLTLYATPRGPYVQEAEKKLNTIPTASGEFTKTNPRCRQIRAHRRCAGYEID